ncbi:MAG: PAS domain-containing protein [Thermosediminibacteraceae bacterium]|nr:PAS domain-containing protein [Thermosediminibacteraceae bacterium]
MKSDWIKNLSVAITICDTEGKIIYMNEKACKTFEKDGSPKLIGKNVLDCHPEPARSKLKKNAGNSPNKLLHHRKKWGQKVNISNSMV